MLRWNVAIILPGLFWLFCGRGLNLSSLMGTNRTKAPVKWSQHFNATYRNIIVACVWPPCCDVLRHVGCWLKFENGQTFHATFVDVAWCCNRLARFVQQCCAWACALVGFSYPTRCSREPNAYNMLHPTMLLYVVFNCCDRLAGYVALRCC